MPGVEERLNRHRRLVVEQDDQLFADVNESDLLVGDSREIDLDFLLVAEIDDDRLVGQRLCQFEDRWRRSVIGISRAGSLRNLKLSVHNFPISRKFSRKFSLKLVVNPQRGQEKYLVNQYFQRDVVKRGRSVAGSKT